MMFSFLSQNKQNHQNLLTGMGSTPTGYFPATTRLWSRQHFY
jgi:hypothetical protein